MTISRAACVGNSCLARASIGPVTEVTTLVFPMTSCADPSERSNNEVLTVNDISSESVR